MNRGERRSTSLLCATVLGISAYLGLAGCVDTGLLVDAAFPTRIAGLSPDQPWVALPVGSWITESGIEPVAVAACFAPACEVRALVAKFRARGQDAAQLALMADDPGRLARELAAPPRPRSSGARARQVAPVSPEQRAIVSVSRLKERSGRGLLVRMSRPDGSRPAYGVVLSAGGPGRLTVLLVVASAEEGAVRLAREVGVQEG